MMGKDEIFQRVDEKEVNESKITGEAKATINKDDNDFKCSEKVLDNHREMKTQMGGRVSQILRGVKEQPKVISISDYIT